MGGRIRSVSFSQLEHFHVCRPKELKLAAGDRLQLKGNGETGTGRNLANGELVTVKSVSSDGRIFEKHYREFVRGYAVTSYASQGKTVAYVLFSDSFPPPWSLARPRSIARSLRSGNDSIAGQSPTKCTDSCDWTLTCFKGRSNVRFCGRIPIRAGRSWTRSSRPSPRPNCNSNKIKQPLRTRRPPNQISL